MNRLCIPVGIIARKGRPSFNYEDVKSSLRQAICDGGASDSGSDHDHFSL
jgi:hypothetical protein